jgi:hypothetical protein
MAKKRKRTKRMRSILLRTHRLSGGESLLGAIQMKQNLIMGAAIGGALGKFANKIQLPVNDTWKSLAKTGIGVLVSSMDGEIVEGIGLGLVGQGTGDLLSATGIISGADIGRLPHTAPQVAREKLEKNILVALEGDEPNPQEDEGEMAGAEAELRALAGAEKVIISGEDDEEEMSGEDDEEGMSGEEYEELSGEEKKVISGLI